MDTAAFKDAYVRLVTRAWSDDSYRQAVLADPVPALRDAGFDLPEGARVRIDTDDYSTYSDAAGSAAGLDAAATWWNEGHRDGTFRLALPEAAPVELAELDEKELSGLAGGICCSCCCA